MGGTSLRKSREIPGMSAISSIEVIAGSQFEYGDSHHGGARGRADKDPGTGDG
jgi:hypothetical protein